ncbi:hypothetical protein ACUIAK_16335 [Bacillus cytotoxicus]
MLKIAGLQKVDVMSAYGYALLEGKLYSLTVEDCNRLIALKKDDEPVHT